MREKLKQLLKDNHWNITEEVIKQSLEYDDPRIFFKDLLQYGCQSWMVWSLIRYRDTHKFFEKHYEEIQEIIEELEQQGIEVKIPSNTDLKNFLAWLWFEERARNLSYELDMGR